MQFSVITINKNNASGLKKTIDSVISQNHASFEFIVIDGASTDKSIEVAKSYGDRIDNFVSEPDCGIYNAMNRGAALANGEYVVFMNSGDAFSSNDILSRVATMLVDADFVIGAMRAIKNNGKTIVEYPAAVTPYTLLFRNFCHQSTFTKTSVLRELGGYDENIRVAADACLLIKAVLKYNKTFVTTNLCITDYDATGYSSNNIKKIKQEKHDYFKTLSPGVYSDYVWAHKWLRLLPSNVLRVIKLKLGF